MFPQRHGISISGSILDQMLQLPSSPMPLPMERSTSRWKPNIEIAPNCPRCASTNTKFCYYNNYSLSQPRYLCKACKRYWTKGGSLRNVPVGGGCRKNRRGKSARNQQSERLAVNSFNGNSGSGDREFSIGDNGQNNNGSVIDIDMALVFAKFLNQNPSSGEEFESGSSSSNLNLSNSLTPESVVETENDAVIQPQKPQELEELRIQNFGGDELSLSGIGEFLGVAADEDVLWSDDAAMSPSINWQPPPPPPPMMQMQFQELEYSMPISSTSTVNLITDSWSSWSSVDLSTMEVFSSIP